MNVFKQSIGQWRVLGAVMGLAGALLAPPAQADGRSATHNLLANMARANRTLGITENNSRAIPTLVRGMYVLNDNTGAFVGIINEAGTIYGDINGFQVLSTTTTPPRKMTGEELRDLQQEVLAAIDYDKLIKVSYGDGGGRKIVLFSAVDCGFCQRFEQDFMKKGSGVNTTFYVVPMSLQDYSGGVAKWQTVSRIWCADNNTAAWRKYWTTLDAAPSHGCEFDPKNAEQAARYLKQVLAAVGSRAGGTPSFVREDGSILNNKADMDLAYMKKTFGAEAMPKLAAPKPAQWLVAAADMPSDAQQPAAVQPGEQQQSKKIKIDVKDALKKLFN
ncbi:thioredoxin fold domain-containing protein [Duganella vulcania]|uniref:Thioredoxin fold domain-containing protein n=1 Tax=Duganella vulcania TaxID=2692166 RepID=A0A845GLW4_9BURK|nr:thioredoxin fold domain-containing protein [Duganella vulcania]MYM94422.1 thioredoxin fold domain-containing protein [Duganella vulcania]